MTRREGNFVNTPDDLLEKSGTTDAASSEIDGEDYSIILSELARGLITIKEAQYDLSDAKNTSKDSSIISNLGAQQ